MKSFSTISLLQANGAPSGGEQPQVLVVAHWLR